MKQWSNSKEYSISDTTFSDTGMIWVTNAVINENIKKNIDILNSYWITLLDVNRWT